MWGLAKLYVEVLIVLLVMRFIFLMESDLGFIMNINWVLMITPLVVWMMENLWVHC